MQKSLSTLLVESHQPNSNKGRATHTPVYQSASFEYDSSESLSKVFQNKARGDIYSRISNPTVSSLEKKVNKLEGGIGAIATSSGMSAITTTILTLAQSNDHIVSSSSIFGGSYALFDDILPDLGIESSFVESTSPEKYSNAIQQNTKAIFIETIGNPQMNVPDIEKISEIARENDIPLIVDSTVTTPVLINPEDYGANIVIHSATKFLEGHGSALGGIIIDCGNFDWGSNRFKHFQEYYSKYGSLAFLAKARKEIYRNFGSYLSPQNSFLISRGLETLTLRLEKQCNNAELLAKYLNNHNKVKKVSYPGLKNNEYHDIARKQFNDQFGSILTFNMDSKNRCFELINSLNIAHNLANLGDIRTLIIHPESTIYNDFNREKNISMGVTNDLIRVSVGIEDSEDIIEDFSQALKEV